MPQRLRVAYKAQDIYYLALYRNYSPTYHIQRMTQTAGHPRAATRGGGYRQDPSMVLRRLHKEAPDRPTVGPTVQNESPVFFKTADTRSTQKG